MTITREQVADLQPGDVVEMSWPEKGATVSVRGALTAGPGHLLLVGSYWVREEDGSPIQGLQQGGRRTLTVVSRAPRPLYVNHPRTEPAPGDVVTWDGNGCLSYGYAGDWVGAGGPKSDIWIVVGGTAHNTTDRLRARSGGRLRLLVDGETAQVVP